MMMTIRLISAIFVISGCLCCPLSLAQSKQETFDFIRGKLNLGEPFRQGLGDSHMEIELVLEGCVLKIEEKLFSYDSKEVGLLITYSVPLDQMDPTRVINALGMVSMFTTGDEKKIRGTHRELPSGEVTKLWLYQANLKVETLYKAERVRRAVAHLIKLCGGATEELFSQDP